MNASERFFAKVTPATDGSGCLLWTGGTTQNCESGYGMFWNGQRLEPAHRWLMGRGYGPIPREMDVDHLCRNTLCVRPTHLEVVTRSENLRRGMIGDVTRARAALITHCPRGHEYTPENTMRSGRGRVCRTCAYERNTRYRASGEHNIYMRARRAGLMVQCSALTLRGSRCNLQTFHPSGMCRHHQKLGVT